LANASSNAEILGDEPYQYFKKFPQIQVAVDANRKNGIEQLLSLNIKPEIILLDDAYQHRKVKASFYVLLTSYGDLFCDDFMLPTGNLRESRRGAKRADVVIVTKCPPNISEYEQTKIKEKLKGFLSRSFGTRNDKNESIFFSSIDYDNKVYSETASLEVSEIKSKEKVLLAGIAKPKPFFDYLQSGKDEVMEFADHHHFNESEIVEIKKNASDKLIITTEKDFVRLTHSDLASQLYYLPIKSKFVSNQEGFDTIILSHVGTRSRNR
jgi:tetraacyldisaccharide 4'-kinase